MPKRTYVLFALFNYQPELILLFTFSTDEKPFSLNQLSIICQRIDLDKARQGFIK